KVRSVLSVRNRGASFSPRNCRVETLRRRHLLQGDNALKISNLRPCSLLLGTLFCLFPLSIFAQTTGEIRGIVKDPSEAIIVGAQVVALMPSASIERRAVTDATGEFTIPTVPVGTYIVRVQHPGFKTFEQ